MGLDMKNLPKWCYLLVVMCCGYCFETSASSCTNFGRVLYGRLVIGEVLSFYRNIMIQQEFSKRQQANNLSYLELSLREMISSHTDLPPEISQILQLPYAQLEVEDHVKFLLWVQSLPESRWPRWQISRLDNLQKLVKTYQTQIRRMSAQMDAGQKSDYRAYWTALIGNKKARRKCAHKLLPIATMENFLPVLIST